MTFTNVGGNEIATGYYNFLKQFVTEFYILSLILLLNHCELNTQTQIQRHDADINSVMQ